MVSPMNLSRTAFLPDLVRPKHSESAEIACGRQLFDFVCTYTILAQSRDEMMVPGNSPRSVCGPTYVVRRRPDD